MPMYVYGCPGEPAHPRQDVAHRIGDDAVLYCQKCGKRLERVPQGFRWGRSAWDVLAEQMDKKYMAWREKRKKGLLRG